jgi:hypothetical protein
MAESVAWLVVVVALATTTMTPGVVRADSQCIAWTEADDVSPIILLSLPEGPKALWHRDQRKAWRTHGLSLIGACEYP